MMPDTRLPRPADYAVLAEPVQLGPVTARNRVFMPPHGTNYANEVGNARLADYYRTRARGGLGLIVHEATPVHPSGARLTGKIHGWKPASVPGFRLVSEATHAEGVPVFVQLYHAGRQMTPGPGMRASWGPSSLQCPETRSPVHPMTKGEIDEVVAGFALSAKHAAEGGIDGVEVHAAHGYLITAFMSCYSNERTDEYGGSFDNRMRFALEIMTAVEQALPTGVVLGVRVSAEELVARGMDVEQTCAALAYLRERVRLDYISVSLGNYTSHENVVPDHTFPPAFNATRAGQIRNALSGIPVLLAGRIGTGDVAAAVISDEQADMVGVVRGHIADPEWAGKVLRGDTPRPCIYCNQDCRTNLGKGLAIACSVNPVVGQEARRDSHADGRELVVIGGGPAGINAALRADAAGFAVTLHERGSALGGQLRIAAADPARPEIGRYLTFLESQLAASKVQVRLGSDATTDAVPAGTDVVVAVGAQQRVPEWARTAGEAGFPVHPAWSVIAGQARPAGRRVVVVDDGEDGWPLASLIDVLRRAGKDVCVVTEGGFVGYHLPPLSVRPFIGRLEQAGVESVVNAAVVGVADGKLTLRSMSTEDPTVTLAFDDLVYSGGTYTLQAVVDAWGSRAGAATHVIGDAYAPRGLGPANRDAADTVGRMADAGRRGR
jgi:2,4-dienoyl-CoA reductase-like NADH-dependent reductase (Old Yellow Enzyme family)